MWTSGDGWGKIAVLTLLRGLLTPSFSTGAVNHARSSERHTSRANPIPGSLLFLFSICMSVRVLMTDEGPRRHPLSAEAAALLIR